ncbi:MAG TPA: rhodanese-like domain-containing protein, partial [Flavisolibacter sp.]|nr:rhodanese-like domain-containing protein [Flavisolibacter sp.]
MKQINVEQLKTRIDSGEKINLIDCREPHEYEEANLGARLIPLGKFQMMDLEELDQLKEEEVIIHCRS